MLGTGQNLPGTGKILGKICLKKWPFPPFCAEKNLRPLYFPQNKVSPQFIFEKKVFAPLSMVPAPVPHTF